MNGAVLISIKPKWCELIISGRKSLEIRKSRPKLETPFKCYIYCTGGNTLYKSSADSAIRLYRKKSPEAFKHHTVMNNKVIGEFVCNRIGAYPMQSASISILSALSLVSPGELYKYAGANTLLYGWHISDLVLYYKPKGYDDFCRICPAYGTDRGQCWECEYAVGEEFLCGVDGCRHLIRPPQSWCYVEEINGGAYGQKG